MAEYGNEVSPVLGLIGKLLLIAAPPMALGLALAMSSQRAAAAACSGSPGDRVDCGNGVFSPGLSSSPARGRAARGHGAAHGGGGHGAGA